MTNKQYLVENLENVAALDESLRRAYRQSLTNRLPPIINPFRALPKISELRRKGLLKWWQHYYAFWFAGMVCGIVAMFTSLWLLIGYLALSFLAADFSSKYIEAYAYADIGRRGITKQSFGLQTPSLFVAGVVDAVRCEHIKLDKETLDSVIKLNKATQEFEEVGFGISEAIRRGIISIPYALSLWLITTEVPVKKYYVLVRDNLISQPILLGATILMLSGLTLLAYQLAFSKTVTKRDRKRYLLVLNLLRETYQERRK